MKVTVVAPHPDDESVGCGATIAAHTDGGDDVSVVWLTSGERGLQELPVSEARAIRESEALKAAHVLGISEHVFLRWPDASLESEVRSLARALAEVLSGSGVDRIYAPHGADGHADHAAAHSATIRALESAGLRASVCGYEVWTPLAHVDFVMPVDIQFDRKIAAIRCHQSQLDHVPLDEAARGLAMYRGALLGGCRFAEAFDAVDVVPGRRSRSS